MHTGDPRGTEPGVGRPAADCVSAESGQSQVKELFPLTPESASIPAGALEPALGWV